MAALQSQADYAKTTADNSFLGDTFLKNQNKKLLNFKDNFNFNVETKVKGCISSKKSDISQEGDTNKIFEYNNPFFNSPISQKYVSNGKSEDVVKITNANQFCKSMIPIDTRRGKP